MPGQDDLDDRIFYCLLASMAAVLADDICTVFLFVGDLNDRRQEWLGSMITNRHGVAAFDFATVSGSYQLVICPINADGGTLNLLMTDVPDLVWVAVVAMIGNSDHSSLSAVIRWLRRFQTCVLVGKFSSNIKSTGILSVIQYRTCSGVTFGLLTILLRF